MELTATDIERRRTRLLASVSVLMIAFAAGSVTLSFLDPEILASLRLAPAAGRLGLLALTIGFLALLVERDRSLKQLASQVERHHLLQASLRNRLDVLESLLDAGDRLNAPLAVDDVLEVLLDAALDLTRAEGGAVITHDNVDGEVGVARHHSVEVDLDTLVLGELVEIPLEKDGQRAGMLLLTTPSLVDDPVVRDVLQAFAERAASALDRARSAARDQASVAYLRAANVVKSRFLETVSHELRTPLTSILGYSKTLEHHWSKLPEGTKLEFTRSIREQGDRLRVVVERILEAARVELEGVVVRRVNHDVRRSLQRALDFGHESHRLEVALPADPVMGELDPFVFEQIVQNLVDNGLRHTSGVVRVSLDAYRDTIVVTVGDQGPGMSSDQLALVVEPLYRIDDRFGSGTGLGLHIVRTLVADHGGRLHLASDERGTRVQVTFPRTANDMLPETKLQSASSTVPVASVRSA